VVAAGGTAAAAAVLIDGACRIGIRATASNVGHLEPPAADAARAAGVGAVDASPVSAARTTAVLSPTGAEEESHPIEPAPPTATAHAAATTTAPVDDRCHRWRRRFPWFFLISISPSPRDPTNAHREPLRNENAKPDRIGRVR
jgi:hypothetical protein